MTLAGFNERAFPLHAYVLRDCAELSAKDFVAWFELSNVLADRFNDACKIQTEAGELWLPQTRKKACKPWVPDHVAVSKIDRSCTNADKNLVLVRYRLFNFRELEILDAVFARYV